jgi:DNA-directed RNA polymerase specialized sigma24 family protein
MLSWKMHTESWEGEARPRREVLWSDFDTLSDEQLLWFDGKASTCEHALSLVRQAVREALSPKQREVVEAYFFEGLSQGQIARRLGIRQQVVHKCLYGVQRGGKRVGGALRRLREVLAPALES